MTDSYDDSNESDTMHLRQPKFYWQRRQLLTAWLWVFVILVIIILYFLFT